MAQIPNHNLSSDIPKGTTNVIAAGNANGMSISPYFVFKGATYLPDLLKNVVAGSAGTVSATG